MDALNQLRIQLRIAKAPAQIAAQGGNHQTVILYHGQKIPALLAGELFGGHFAPGGVHLHALCPQLRRRGQRFRHGLAEGIRYDANGKMIHNQSSLNQSLNPC